ncbi:hypothetical protein RB623_06835 [Mesorhizobium sp. LHD-90]|uniref:hypothetical protein n=1 Tax=Mesorhizobium sp. LHD-90 TaxID=3071414 RepID=UPI0027E08BBE|nr:hypothetical protein [Mesorhizobium sp. LHD-90]MDQ6433766.1 hypothetical protein [Mesorhizobium sp. LHD-90]
MAQIRLADIRGNEFVVPERLSGDGPEIEIIVCSTGEFIDPARNELSFMARPDPPEIVRLEVVQGTQRGASIDMPEVWQATDEELELARKEAAEIRSVENAVRKVWG